MKNLFKLMLLFITAGLLITSCKTASITKRHYNKGYYVSHSGKKGKVNTNQIGEKQQVVVAEPLAPKTTPLPEITNNKQLLASNVSIPSQKTTSEGAVHTNKKIETKNNLNRHENNISMKEMVMNPFKITKVITAGDAGNDALSLIWILIVILLVIYIAGLLLDNFGLGGLFHILGVILLVLLILWLLRII